MMRRIFWPIVLFAPVLLMGAAPLGESGIAPGSPISFKSCPILRREPESMRLSKQVPCWMARHEGKLYYIGRQEDMSAEVFPPQFRHQVLVEGVVAKGPAVCGGIAIQPIRLSIMPELDFSCQEMLPAQGHLAPPGAHDAEPSRRDGIRTRPEIKAGADGVYRFPVLFSFDSDHVDKFAYLVVETVAKELLSTGRYALELQAVTNPAELTPGGALPEKDGVGRERVEAIVAILRGLGQAIEPKVVYAARNPTSNGLANYSGRHVVMVVRPI